MFGLGDVPFHVALLSPAVALSWTWRMRGIWNRFKGASWLALQFGTASYCFLWLGGAIYRPLLGPDYSQLRYTMIGVNLIANLVLALVVPILGGFKRPSICVAGSCGLVASSWFYMGAVNSTV